MAMDPYSPCPGGTGKKVKFCCPDLLGELDKISHMLEGDQPRACLDHIESLEDKFANRACLCTIKASLQQQLGQTEAAKQTVDKFLQTQPDNPIALAEAAILAAQEQHTHDAVHNLQRALKASGNEILPQVFAAIGVVAGQLVAAGHYLAARQHLVLQLRLDPQDSQAMQAIVRLSTPREVPLLFKDDPKLKLAPEGVPWLDEFDQSMQLIGGYGWAEGEQRLSALAERVGNSPVLWHNLALVRGWLADEPGMMAALRRISALDAPREVPIDDAIEAEALAQLVDPIYLQDTVDELLVTYPITDMDQLASLLASDKRLQRVPGEYNSPDPNRPPPRSVYWLLDKPLPATGKDLTLEQVPNVLATLFVYGRETDRPARIELELFRSEDQTAGDLLVELAGNAIGIRSGEEILGRVQASQMLLSWHWRLPDDTPRELAESLTNQQRRTTVLNRWPKAPQAVLGGKTPTDVASDPTMRIRLSASLLLLELSLDHPTSNALVNELRGRLGLPLLHPIDPTTINPDELPLVRLARLPMEKLSDENLILVYRRASLTQARLTLRKAATEIIQRDGLEGKFDKGGAYGVLSRLEEDPDKVAELLIKARETSEAAGRSGAQWALDELVLRMRRGQVQEAGLVMQHLQTRYGRDPQVRMALTQILMSAGVIGPDGRPVPPPSASESSGLVVPGAPTGEGGKLWTPGGESSQPGKKPALWTPS